MTIPQNSLVEIVPFRVGFLLETSKIFICYTNVFRKTTSSAMPHAIYQVRGQKYYLHSSNWYISFDFDFIHAEIENHL